MCGRFTLRAPASVVASQFGLFEIPPFAPRFNIAPSQTVAVVRLAPEKAGRQRQLAWLRWGLIPRWAEDPAIGNRMINARAETVADKPAYRAPLRQQRCLLPADGFYEWQHTGKRKQPYFICLRDDRLFAFAGLWEAWEGPDDSSVESCTLLTTEPNELIRPIHNRMPVILHVNDYHRWLDPALEDPERLPSLLHPHPSDEMTAHPVSTFVNNPDNDNPKCIEPR